MSFWEQRGGQVWKHMQYEKLEQRLVQLFFSGSAVLSRSLLQMGKPCKIPRDCIKISISVVSQGWSKSLKYVILSSRICNTIVRKCTVNSVYQGGRVWLAVRWFV